MMNRAGSDRWTLFFLSRVLRGWRFRLAFPFFYRLAHLADSPLLYRWPRPPAHPFPCVPVALSSETPPASHFFFLFPLAFESAARFFCCPAAPAPYHRSAVIRIGIHHQANLLFVFFFFNLSSIAYSCPSSLWSSFQSAGRGFVLLSP